MNGISQDTERTTGPSGPVDDHDQSEEMERITHAVETERARIRRKASDVLADAAGGSHQGGMGAQGGQVDFGNPENYGRF